MKIYLSSLLPEQYPIFWINLKSIFQEHHIPYSFLPHTKDIWARDFMPVQIEDGSFIQFCYEPAYLKDSLEIRTDSRKVTGDLGIEAIQSDLIVDGGNIILGKGLAFCTDKIFKENSHLPQNEVKAKLSEVLNARLIILPVEPHDWIGHSDAMVRITAGKLIVNNYLDMSKSWMAKYEKALTASGLVNIPDI